MIFRRFALLYPKKIQSFIVLYGYTYSVDMIDRQTIVLACGSNEWTKWIRSIYFE